MALVHAIGGGVLATCHAVSAMGAYGENADRFFPSVEAMVAWVDQPSLVPFLERVSEDLAGEFREFVVRRMIEETMQPGGTCFEMFRRINVSASG